MDRLTTIAPGGCVCVNVTTWKRNHVIPLVGISPFVCGTFCVKPNAALVFYAKSRLTQAFVFLTAHTSNVASKLSADTNLSASEALRRFLSNPHNRDLRNLKTLKFSFTILVILLVEQMVLVRRFLSDLRTCHLRTWTLNFNFTIIF